uniref:Uncharacterized protein n=1 Tax=Acrobeloides nanus TaxID=290746 RepID=A0A914CIU2_9BILA
MGKATLTVGLLAANELIMFVMPDIFVYISPKASYNFIFFVMTLNKGFVNMLLLLMTQKEIRQEIQKVLSKKWFIQTGPITVIKKPSDEIITKLMIRRVVLHTHGSI